MRSIYFALAVIFFALAAAMSWAMDMKSVLEQAVSIDPVQPTRALTEQLERRPRLGEAGVRPAGAYPKSALPYQPSKLLMLGGLPYYQYYSLKDGAEHVIHPMTMGRFLLRNASGSMAEEVLRSVVDIASPLPNGGLAWYYPRHFRVNRMMGDRLKYSSISQGTLLAGLSVMGQRESPASFAEARKAFLALLWPFERGGVNLANRAVLEMPSFSGPPEIILNGWIDALLHVSDYGIASGDEEARSFLLRNIAFLVEILPRFDDRQSGLSRYSDTSPYRAKVTLAAPADVDTLTLLYVPRIVGLPTIRVPLSRTKNPSNTSIYDNQILRQNGRIAHVWLSCSQLYETVVISHSDEMSVEIDLGTVDRRQSTPGFGGAAIHRESEVDGNYRVIRLSTDDGLICGYPTNFAKSGSKNFYHAYHVIGLMLLALMPEATPEQRHDILRMAFLWFGDAERITKTEHARFHDWQDMLDDINANRAQPAYRQFDELLRAAQAAAD